MRTQHAHSLIPEEMTLEEFLNWEDEDIHAEWVAGKVRIKMPSSKLHQDVNGFLHALLKLWVERYRPGGMVYHPPTAVRLLLPDGREEVREPDLIVILPEHAERMHRTYFEGAPDLVVEIISPDSRSVDRGEKFYTYEQAGVPEYWMIDPDRRVAEFAQRSESDVYQVVLSASKGTYHSRVLEGFWIQVEWLWSPPTLWEVLQAWGLL